MQDKFRLSCVVADKRYGRKPSPEEMAKRAATFWRPLDVAFGRHYLKGDVGECWDWRGATDRKGYGQIRRDSKLRTATHVALELDGRPRPDNSMFALHSCDNSSCVNPQHLRWGTAKENTQDAMSRGRMKLHGLEMAPSRRKGLSS